MTKVIHIKDAPKDWKDNPDYQYIGRAGKEMDGYFGNPFRMSEYTTREEVVEQYRHWFAQTIERDKDFKQKVLELKDKTLVCFCRSKEDPPEPMICHGDVIADYVNSK